MCDPLLTKSQLQSSVLAMSSTSCTPENFAPGKSWLARPIFGIDLGTQYAAIAGVIKPFNVTLENIPFHKIRPMMQYSGDPTGQALSAPFSMYFPLDNTVPLFGYEVDECLSKENHEIHWNRHSYFPNIEMLLRTEDDRQTEFQDRAEHIMQALWGLGLCQGTIKLYSLYIE
jgi:hypothetical protein